MTITRKFVRYRTVDDADETPRETLVTKDIEGVDPDDIAAWEEELRQLDITASEAFPRLSEDAQAFLATTWPVR
jgi:hypothetical protein